MGKNEGDIISVEIERDEEERKLEVPEDFRQTLDKNPSAKDNLNNNLRVSG
ncbi:MAG: hypothetical protein M1371_08330 [Actinobacteria bacterium]|nr:hypothetical protein [Actinomycetota bacterium]